MLWDGSMIPSTVLLVLPAKLDSIQSMRGIQEMTDPMIDFSDRNAICLVFMRGRRVEGAGFALSF